MAQLAWVSVTALHQLCSSLTIVTSFWCHPRACSAKRNTLKLLVTKHNEVFKYLNTLVTSMNCLQNIYFIRFNISMVGQFQTDRQESQNL